MKRIVILHEMQMFLQQIQEIAPDWEIIIEPNAENARPFLKDAEIILGWSSDIERICLNQESSLRWLQIWSAGVDYLPMDKLREKEIVVTSGSGMNKQQLSEVAIGLMIALVRGFRQAFDDQALGVWNSKAASTYGLNQIHGKTLAILGAGKVGTELAKLAKAFDMTVLGLTRTGGRRQFLDEVYNIAFLDEMLSKADFVVNVLPLTPMTRGIIDKRQFACMKPTAFYINIGRGATTSTMALIDALKDGTIAGAGLDVIDPEPLPSDSPLWTMQKVILHPHVGGIGPENNERVADIFIQNLKSYLSVHLPAQNIIDLEQCY